MLLKNNDYINNNIILSIIVPFYNNEFSCKKTLMSIISQLNQSVELLIIDDGSTDNTLDIIKEIVYSNNGNIQIISQVNKGVSCSRNKGIKHARGKYVTFIDGDDWVSENYINSIISEIMDSNADIYIYDFYINNSIYTKDIELYEVNREDYLNAILNMKIAPAIWTKIIKKDIFTKNNVFFDEKLRIGEDLLISFNIGFYAQTIKMISEAYLHYEINDHSVTYNITEKNLDIIEVLTKIKKILIKNESFIYFYSSYENCKFIHLYKNFLFSSKKINKNHKLFFEKIKLITIDIEKINTLTKLDKIHYFFYKQNYYLGTIITNLRVTFSFLRKLLGR